MSKCNTHLFYGCCPSVTPVDPEENKKPEEGKKEEQKPEVKPVPTPEPKPCCHDFKVQHITVVGDEVLVVLDDCTFLKAPLTVLDKSVGTAKDEMDKANVTELQKALAELTEKVKTLESKEDKDTIFDPATLEERITALENKADKDTVYDDSTLAARVKALEDAPAGDKVDTTAFVRKDELVDVQNWAGTTRFKAYPANVGPKTVNPRDKI